MSMNTGHLIFPQDPVAQHAVTICATLQAKGHRALLAGGCVRDLMLGRTPADYDIATDALPEETMALFPHTRPVGIKFGVVLVIVKGTPYEVACFRKDGPYLDGRRPETVSFSDEKEDARRRDFTINALFYDPARQTVLDYVNGIADLHAGILRAVGDPQRRFQEDRLRMLRALRFSVRFSYAIEGRTWRALCREREAITQVSTERIRDELIRLLTEGKADRALQLLDESGFLKILLPEVAAMKGVEQPPEFHPEGDVFTHTRLALSHLPAQRSEALTLALLLHDTGKVKTQRFDAGRIRFFGHDQESSVIARRICERFLMPVKTTERIAWLVKQHMRIHHFQNMRLSKQKQLLREPGFHELLVLARCDALGSNGDMNAVDYAEKMRNALGDEDLSPTPLLTGNDLIALGYEPDRRFRRMLEAVERGQLDGTLADRAEAIALVERIFGPPGT